MRRRRRFIPLLLLCLATAAQVAASVQSSVGVGCVESCPDDDETGHCPPSCFCACHAPQRPAPPPVSVARLAAPAQSHVPVEVSAPASPDPEPLWHVPKNEA